MAKQNKDNGKTPLFMHLKTSKENRVIEVTERHAGGKFAGLNRIYRNNMNEVMKTSLLFSLFFLPFLVLTIWALGYMLNLSDGRFFIGGLGLDYHPGMVSELTEALIGRLQVHTFYFALVIPSFTIMGLGLAGSMYVARKMFYEEDYKVMKTFFTGIKKYWWKMMFVTTLIGVLIFAVAECFIEFYKLDILGQLTGGWYALLFFAMLIGVMILMVLLQIPSQIVTYDNLKFRYMFRNAFILAIENWLWTILFIAFAILPVIFIVYLPILAMIIYVILFMFGFMYYIMMNLQIGNYAFDLYMNPIYDALGEEGVVFENKKDKQNVASVEQQPKKKKKKPAQQPYVNPKKKKSQKKK